MYPAFIFSADSVQCHDLYSSCDLWSQYYDYCNHKYNTWMYKSCKNACGWCGMSSPPVCNESSGDTYCCHWKRIFFGQTCSVGEGGCQSSNDCQEGLVCDTKLCTAYGWQHNLLKRGCCGYTSDIPTSCNSNSYVYDCCTSQNPCSVGVGGCNYDSDCQGNLICGGMNGASCGPDAPRDFRCCVDPNNIPAPSPTTCNSFLDWNCCNNQYPCGQGSGDCDSDDHCAGDLICGDGNCGPNAPAGFDCCKSSSNGYDECSTSNQCNAGEGHCQSHDQCQSGLVCGTQNCGSTYPSDYNCCMTPTLDYCQTNPCNEGEGDCDADDDCQSGLVCGIDNCGWYWPQGYDCCMTPSLNYCSPSSKCGEGIGHCDSHAECEEGLACGTNNCGASWPNGYNCCYTPQCHNSDSPAWDCCQVDSKCGQGLGDCDSDDECENGLVCKADSCGSDWPEGYDCCVLP